MCIRAPGMRRIIRFSHCYFRFDRPDAGHKAVVGSRVSMHAPRKSCRSLDPSDKLVVVAVAVAVMVLERALARRRGVSLGRWMMW